MVQPGHIIRVLIASPGDVREERDAIVNVIENWNATHSLELAVIIEPVRWETHSSPLQGARPQEIINTQLVRHCDICIGIFWTRLGSDTGIAPSGTVEELMQFVSSSRPALLYFSDRTANPSKIDLEQFAKVKRFKEDISARGLHQGFTEISELREKVDGHLHQAVIEVMSKYKRSLKGIDSDPISQPAIYSVTSIAAERPSKLGPIAVELTERKITLSDALEKTLDLYDEKLSADDAQWIYKELKGYDKPGGAVKLLPEGGTATAHFPLYRQPIASKGKRFCVLEPIRNIEYYLKEKRSLEVREFSGRVEVTYIQLREILKHVENELLEKLNIIEET